MTGGTADLKSAARALDEALVERALAGDMAGMVDAYYAEDAVLLPPGHPPLHGRAAILPYWEAIGQGLVTIALDTTTVDGDDQAGYGVGTGQLAIGGPDGAPVQETITYLLAYRRQADGAWKVVANMWNPAA